jgi:hypothetical protein
MRQLIRLPATLILSVSLTALTAQAAETYYKWDRDGVTQYTKEKPLGVPYEEVRTIGGKAHPTTSAPAAKATQDSATSPDTAAGKATDKAAVKKDPQVCERAKANLETLQSRAQVRMKDEYGEMQVMSDQQRDEQIKKAQEAIKTHC